jgi:valyl-tRNA synthetase
MEAKRATDPHYGYTAHLAGVSFDEARARVIEALKREGFGVLTEIDVTSTSVCCCRATCASGRKMAAAWCGSPVPKPCSRS